MELEATLFADQGVMAGGQLLDVLKSGARRQAGPTGKDLIERQWIESEGYRRVRGQGLDFRSEDEHAIANGVEERTNAHAIAGQKQLALMGVPDGDAELTIETTQAGRAFLFVVVQHDLGVAMRLEAVAAGEEFFAQFGVVEDLTVVNDPVAAVLSRDRLLAGGKIDDAQAGVAEANLVVEIDAELVGSAMADHGQHAAEQVLGRRLTGA